MGYCHLINSQGVKETITLSCFQIDECENIVSITYSLLFVSNSSFVAILSTNEIRHVEFSFREGKMGYFIKTLHILNHVVGHVSQKGHYFVDANNHHIYHLTSNGVVSSQDLVEHQPAEFYTNVQESVWKIIDIEAETMIYIPDSRDALRYYDHTLHSSFNILQTVCVMKCHVQCCRVCPFTLLMSTDLNQDLFFV